MAAEYFKNRSECYPDVRKKWLTRAIPIVLLSATGGFSIAYFNFNGQKPDATFYIIIIPILLFSVSLGLYRGIKRQKLIFDTYCLSFDDGNIIREQHNTSTITIPYGSISEIIKNTSGSFTIRGSNASDIIGISKYIENIEKIEKLLSEIQPVKQKENSPFYQKYIGLLPILVIALMFAVFVSKSKIIVGTGGIILISFLVYSFISVRRSKNVDKKTKKGIWWNFLVVASVAGIIFFRIFAPASIESDSLLRSGESKFDNGDYINAIKDYKKIIQVDPKNVLAYYKIGYTYSTLKQYQESIEYCSRAIEINKQYKSAYIERAYSKSHTGDYKGAIEDCATAISLDPDNETAYINRANARLALEDYNSAIVDCDSAIIINPVNSTPYYYKGYAHEGLKQFDDAINDYKKAIKVAPAESEAYNFIGQIQNSQQRYDEAKINFDSAIRISADYSDAYHNRGLSYWGLRDSLSACNDWNHAFALGDSSVLEEIKAHCKK